MDSVNQVKSFDVIFDSHVYRIPNWFSLCELLTQNFQGLQIVNQANALSSCETNFFRNI